MYCYEYAPLRSTPYNIIYRASHKFYVKSTQVDGIAKIKIIPLPKIIKICNILRVIPPPTDYYG